MRILFTTIIILSGFTGQTQFLTQLPGNDLLLSDTSTIGTAVFGAQYTMRDVADADAQELTAHGHLKLRFENLEDVVFRIGFQGTTIKNKRELAVRHVNADYYHYYYEQDTAYDPDTISVYYYPIGDTVNLTRDGHRLTLPLSASFSFGPFDKMDVAISPTIESMRQFIQYAGLNSSIYAEIENVDLLLFYQHKRWSNRGYSLTRNQSIRYQPLEKGDVFSASATAVAPYVSIDDDTRYHSIRSGSLIGGQIGYTLPINALRVRPYIRADYYGYLIYHIGAEVGKSSSRFSVEYSPSYLFSALYQYSPNNSLSFNLGGSVLPWRVNNEVYFGLTGGAIVRI